MCRGAPVPPEARIGRGLERPGGPQSLSAGCRGFESGLSDWDISRDAPYFGFEIPDAPNKYFYVWVDAPIGYMSSFENYVNTKRPDLNFDDYWKKDSDKEVAEGTPEVAPVIKTVTVDTLGVDYGMPEVQEAFDYNGYLQKMYGFSSDQM